MSVGDTGRNFCSSRTTVVSFTTNTINELDEMSIISTVELVSIFSISSYYHYTFALGTSDFLQIISQLFFFYLLYTQAPNFSSVLSHLPPLDEHRTMIGVASMQG